MMLDLPWLLALHLMLTALLVFNPTEFAVKAERFEVVASLLPVSSRQCRKMSRAGWPWQPCYLPGRWSFLWTRSRSSAQDFGTNGWSGGDYVWPVGFVTIQNLLSTKIQLFWSLVQRQTTLASTIWTWFVKWLVMVHSSCCALGDPSLWSWKYQVPGQRQSWTLPYVNVSRPSFMLTLCPIDFTQGK